MRKKLQKKEMIKDAFLFLLKFNLLLIPFYLIIYFDVNFYPLQTFIAKSIVFVLNIFGLDAKSFDFFVYLGQGSFIVDISRDCTGWKSFYSLLAMVIASPGVFLKKRNFLLKWLPAMVLINLIRLSSTIFMGFTFGFSLMEPYHNAWQNLNVLLIVGIWYLYMRKNYFVSRKKEKG